MKWSIVAVDDKNEPLEDQEIEEGGEAQLVVQLRRVNPAATQHVPISNFPKQKEASWFIIVANPDTKEIICLKRVAFKRHSQKSMVIVLPQSFDTPLQVSLMCDSYIGLDQIYSIDLYNVNERISSLIPKKVSAKKTLDVKETSNKKGDSDDSYDGFECYNLMRKYQESLQKL